MCCCCQIHLNSNTAWHVADLGATSDTHGAIVMSLLLSFPPRFSFFSRDKQRGLQRSAHLDAGFDSWAGKDGVYTEQAQEALQHL